MTCIYREEWRQPSGSDLFASLVLRLLSVSGMVICLSFGSAICFVPGGSYVAQKQTQSTNTLLLYGSLIRVT